MRHATTRFLAIAFVALTFSLAACDSGPSKRAGDVGSLKMALDVATGITVNTISYVITGPGAFMPKTGTIDVSNSSTISADISPLPQGTGFSISLSATSQEGDAMCVGSQTFDVVAHQTTSVVVHLLCKQPTKNGSINVNGALNVCPLIDSIGSSPAEVFVGGSIIFSGQGHDADSGPSALTYQWTASPPAAGSFNNSAAQNPSFVCSVAGPVSVTLAVSDGDMACVDTQTISVTCTSGSVTGAGGAGGATGGAGGATGGAGGATGGAGGATGGAGGATGGAGGATGGAPGGSGGTTGSGGTGGMGVSCGPGSNNAAVVVYRVGDGGAASPLLNTGNVVYLDAFTAGGALGCSTALPTTASGMNHSLIASGTATSEGLISRSTDGHFIVLAGYGGTLGVSSLAGTTSAATPRVVGRVDAAGAIDTTTALTDWASANNPRSVASTDGTNLWLGGAAGSVRFATLGATTSTQLNTTLTNIRQVGIFGGQLYESSSSSTFRLTTVGTGLPTTAGQTITNLPAWPTTGSPYAFFFADLDGNPGVDTVYVADDGSSGTFGGMNKYSLVGGSWAASGILGATADAYRGVTGVQSGLTVTLYATRKGGAAAAGGGELVSIVDTSGFNAAITGTPAVLATAASNTAFRGVALAPQ